MVPVVWAGDMQTCVLCHTCSFEKPAIDLGIKSALTWFCQ